MSKASASNPDLIRLADSVISGQQSEIDEMKQILAELDAIFDKKLG